MRDEKNTSDELTEAGRKSAKAAGTLAKAGAKAAAGNTAGAAAEVLSDSETVKIIFAVIISILVLVGILLITVLYVIPMMIYETVENTVSDANESFMAGFYSSGESGLAGQILGIAQGIGNWISSLANSLKAQFSSIFSDAEQISSAFNFDTLIANDSQIVSGAGSHVVSVWNKMSQVKAKYTARAEALELAITGKEAEEKVSVESENYTGRTKDFLLQKAYQEFCSIYNPEWDVLVSASWVPAYVKTELTANQALEIAALYDVIHDNDFNAAKLTDFLKWLGYGSKAHGDTVHFEVMGDDTELSGWTGTYMPQYLVDEAKIHAKDAADAARAEKLKELEKLFYRITELAFTEEQRSNAVEKAYNKAYREVLDEYTEEYGVSLIDLLIYCYTGNLTQTEEPGEDDPDRNLLVIKNGAVISAKEYGRGHPPYTFSGWRYSGYGTENQVDLLRKFIADYGLENYEYTDRAENTDGMHEGHIVLKTEVKPKTYSREVSFSMWFDSTDGIWYYRYNGSVYTTNPVSGSENAAAKFHEQVRQMSYGTYGEILASEWDTYPTVYERIGSEYRPVPLSFTYTETYSRMEPYVTAQFFKYYYRVSYFCPYYIACRDRSEMLSLSGLLDGNYDREHLIYMNLVSESQYSASAVGEEGGKL